MRNVAILLALALVACATEQQKRDRAIQDQREIALLQQECREVGDTYSACTELKRRAADRRSSIAWRNGLRGAAIGMQGVGGAMVAASQSGQPAAAQSCASDFQCGGGSVCVKPYYSATGTCRASVNQYGVQQFNPPSASSVGVRAPSVPDCRNDGECATGFRCELASGTCVR